MIKSISGTNQVVGGGGGGCTGGGGGNGGSSWYQLTNHASIDLSPNANAAILWAIDKMAEEAELKKLANTHPAVRAAYDAYKRAGEQLKATIILSKDESLETHR